VTGFGFYSPPADDVYHIDPVVLVCTLLQTLNYMLLFLPFSVNSNAGMSCNQ